MTIIDVFEPATAATFEPQNYLLANADLRDAEVDPTIHFRECGYRENRIQVSRAFLNVETRRRKFERFRSILDIGDTYTDCFPVSHGVKHFSLDEYEGESANDGFGPFIDEIASNPGKLYLDLGSGLRRQVFENCLYVEVYPSLTADLIVAPTCTYPIKSGSLDGVGSFAVLEHVRQPWVVVQEIHRMLKPGGRVYIDWPFLQPVHGFPSHYFNATREGLRTIFEDVGINISEVVTMPHQMPDYTVDWAFGKFIRGLPEKHRDKIMAMTVEELLCLF
jgi:SAM-dependent methyltransferase